MLREQRQPLARQPVRDPGVNRLQPLDRREQPERPALRRLDESRISAGKRGDIVPADVGDDQHFRAGGIVEWAIRLEVRGGGRKMKCSGPRVGKE